MPNTPAVSRFKTERLEELAKRHKQTSKLGENFNFSENAFENFNKSRSKALTEVLTANNESIKQFVAARDKNPEIKWLDDPTPQSYTKEMLKFKASAVALTQLAQRQPAPHPRALLDEYRDMISDAKKQITAQIKSDLKQLDDLFNNQEFKAKLSAANDLLLTDSKIAEVHTALKQELENKHQELSKQFDKETVEVQTQIQDALSKDLNSFLMTANFRNENSRFQKQLKKMPLIGRLSKIDENHPPTEIEFTEKEQKITTFNEEQIKAIAKFTNGLVVHSIDQETNKDLFSVNIPFDRSLKFVKMKPEKKEKELNRTYDSLMQGLRASGAKSVKITVDYGSKEAAEEHARRAYRAAIQAGYPPEKIEINAKENGKTFKLFNLEQDKSKELSGSFQQLYHNHMDEYNELRMSSAAIQNEFAQIGKRDDQQIKDFRKELAEGRKQFLDTQKDQIPIRDLVDKLIEEDKDLIKAASQKANTTSVNQDENNEPPVEAPATSIGGPS